MRVTSSALLGVITGLLAGCVALPLPVHDPVTEEALQSLQIGKTRKAQVLDTLGAPNRLDHPRFAVYEGYSSPWAILVLIPGPPGGGVVEPSDRYRRILIEYDNDGVVADFVVEDGKAEGKSWTPLIGQSMD
jgi:hypothetical protein